MVRLVLGSSVGWNSTTHTSELMYAIKMPKNKRKPVVAIIVPCLNEELVINTTYKSLTRVLNSLIKRTIVHPKSFIVFIDDGSNDTTWEKIRRCCKNNRQKIRGIRLSKNFGHQNALLAGIVRVKNNVDCAITIDADLQQDINVLPEFITKYKKGADLVFGIRKNRLPDSWMKKTTALTFYKLMHFFGVRLIDNHADYRLISKRVMETLTEFNEVNIFLRGILANLGFETAYVYYQVYPRAAGNTKYNFRKMLLLAIEGITSFSIAPMRLISILGLSIFSLTLMMITYYGIIIFVIKDVIPGWASTILPIYFIGGIQLMSLGVIGEYIGKIYMETKRRPRFIIADEIQ